MRASWKSPERRGAGIARALSRFGDRRGGVAVLFGVALLPLLGSVGLAVDVSSWYAQRAKLQAAADGAALASARELRVAHQTHEQIRRIAIARAEASVAEHGLDPARTDIEAVVVEDGNGVRVDISGRLDRAFSALVTDALVAVDVTSTAKVSGNVPICVIGLDPGDGKTIHLEKRAALDARGCAVYSNSTHQQGLRIDNDASLRAALICSSGGKAGPHAAFHPTPRTDCPPMEDPLASRVAPAVGACSQSGLVVRSDVHLAPGVYCGGITITDGARVTLGSGLYVVKDGPFVVEENGSVTGRYVSFHFVGDDAVIDFRARSTIDLTAMRDGPLAGLLFYEDRSAPLDRDFRIESDNARNLLGTIYLPRGHLFVNSGNRIADRSAFTVIVARKLELTEGPELVLNTDYDDTDIPVPEGVGPVGDVLLSQ